MARATVGDGPTLGNRPDPGRQPGRADPGRLLVAPGWGAAALGIAVFLLAGSLLPFSDLVGSAGRDVAASAGSLITVGLSALAAIDAFRRSPAGRAFTAGVGLLLVFSTAATIRLLTLSDLTPGGGPIALGVAATLGVVVITAMLVAAAQQAGVSSAESVRRAPGWIAGLIAPALVLLLVAWLVPPDGVELGDYLFGDDVFLNLVSVSFLATVAALGVLAVVTRSEASLGLVLGFATFLLAEWVVDEVRGATLFDRLADSADLAVLEGMSLGVMVAAVGLALVLASSADAGSPAGAHARSSPLAIIAVVALIAGPVGATVGTVAHLGGEDSTGPGLIDSGLDAGPGEGTSTTGSTRGAGHDTDVDVVCTDLVDSSVEDSTWDGSTLRVTIYIQNDCSISQMLADRDARFTVYVADRSYTGDLAGQAAASGDFDFTRQPVALGPGEGGTFTLVFGDRASLDPLAARAATTQGTPTVTYSYTCTEPDGAAGSVGRVRVAADGVGEEERIRSTPTGPARTEADALSRLEAIRADDAPGVSTDLVGRWVPQLSAKQVGLEADGIVYDNRSTLDNHLQLRNTYPEVRLVWSGDFSSFKLGGFWVTLAGVTFPTPEGANGWCDAQGIGPDDCFAKRLSDAGSYEGNTRHRGN